MNIYTDKKLVQKCFLIMRQQLCTLLYKHFKGNYLKYDIYHRVYRMQNKMYTAYGKKYSIYKTSQLVQLISYN